jgi:hypothetical protein
MKLRILLAAAAVALLAAGTYCFYCFLPAPPPPGETAVATAPPPEEKVTLRTNNDPQEVFHRAFWQRPSPEDRILHAERREWSDENGVKRWQWFLAVEPSPALVKRLRVDNAFGVRPLNTAPSIPAAPPWFKVPGDVETLAAAHGNLRLLFTKSDKLLYATDHGGGFRPGVPESAI